MWWTMVFFCEIQLIFPTCLVSCIYHTPPRSLVNTDRISVWHATPCHNSIAEWKETLETVSSELPGTCPHDWHDVSLLTACTLNQEESLQPLLADAGPRGACVATAGSASICCGHVQFKAVSSEAFYYISVVCEMSPVVTIELGAKSIEGDSTEHGRVQWETLWSLFTTVDWRLPASSH